MIEHETCMAYLTTSHYLIDWLIDSTYWLIHSTAGEEEEEEDAWKVGVARENNPLYTWLASWRIFSSVVGSTGILHIH